MAQQIEFAPPSLTPKPEFRNRMPSATEDRAEAILAGYELLEVARRCEAIDLLQGVTGARTTIIEQFADFASKPASVTALRNLIALAKVLGELDSDVLSSFGRELQAGRAKNRSNDSPPSLWQLAKHTNHPDVRRGLSFILQSVEALGRAVHTNPTSGGTTDARSNSKA